MPLALWAVLVLFWRAVTKLLKLSSGLRLVVVKQAAPIAGIRHVGKPGVRIAATPDINIATVRTRVLIHLRLTILDMKDAACSLVGGVVSECLATMEICILSNKSILM